MPYMPGESTQGPDGRRKEADRIISMVYACVDMMEPYERKFLEEIQDGPVTPKQIFWLRDIKDKYL